MTRRKLPAGFEELEQFVEAWALATMAARHQRRIASAPAERKAFYSVMMPRLGEVAKHLDGFPLHAMPAEAATLMQLALSLTEVSLTQEVYTDEYETAHAQNSRLAQISREIDGL